MSSTHAFPASVPCWSTSPHTPSKSRIRSAVISSASRSADSSLASVCAYCRCLSRSFCMFFLLFGLVVYLFGVYVSGFWGFCQPFCGFALLF